jgi:hypothetical protein
LLKENGRFVVQHRIVRAQRHRLPKFAQGGFEPAIRLGHFRREEGLPGGDDGIIRGPQRSGHRPDQPQQKRRNPHSSRI